MPDFLSEAQSLFEYTQSLRRDLHMHPELGFHEVRTAGIVAKELNALDMEVTTGVAKTGVVGMLEGGKPGPVVLIRFDMDALPVTEETGASYASTNPGKMHACGHDGHTAIGLTVAKMLHAHRDQLAGSVKFVFQPAEEGTCGEEIGGNEMMIREGVLESPKPDLALAHAFVERKAARLGTRGWRTGDGRRRNFQDNGNRERRACCDPESNCRPGAGGQSDRQRVAKHHVPQYCTVTVRCGQRDHDPCRGGLSMSSRRKQKWRAPSAPLSWTCARPCCGASRRSCRAWLLAMGCTAEVTVKRLTPALINADEIAARVQESARQYCRRPTWTCAAT